MHPEITIEIIKDFQVAGLFELVRNIYLSSEFMSDDFDRKFPGKKQFEDYYKSMLRQPGSMLLGAFCNQVPAGYLSVEANPATKLSHTAQLNMGINQSFRGKGLGRKLIKTALQKVKSEGIVEIIYLMVRADHSGAVGLYEASGFGEVARLEKDTKIGNDYFDGILMRKVMP